MVSRLRSPNADLTIDLDEGPHQLGKAITGRVTLLPGVSFHMRGGKVEFICTETYWKMVRRTTRMGSAETNESAATIIREYSQPIFNGAEIANLMPQVSDINFTIPLNAPPTVQGRVCNITWRLKATLDVARALDISREFDLVVLPVPRESSVGGSGPPAENAMEVAQLAECDLNLSLAALRVSVGENMEGVFRIFPKEGFAPEAVRVELIRLEKAGTSQAD